MSWEFMPIRGQGKKCEVCGEDAIIKVTRWGSNHDLCKQHCRGFSDKKKSISTMKKEGGYP